MRCPMRRILKEHKLGVIFRSDRVTKTKGPGLIILVRVVERMAKVISAEGDVKLISPSRQPRIHEATIFPGSQRCLIHQPNL